MNMFYRRSINEYQRQISLKESFAIQTERLRDVLESAEQIHFDGMAANRRRLGLLLLLPLVEIAWADGRVTRREMDAIVQTAEVYELIDDSEFYRELIGRLLARPTPNEVGRMWQNFHSLLENLPRGEREIVAFALLAQAQFVAEQSTDGIIGFLRGERICKDEQEALRLVAEQLERAKQAANETERRKMYDNLMRVQMKMYQARSQKLFGAKGDGNAALDSAETKPLALVDDSDKLIPLIPLVKVAWAEGRITKRERELIFGAAERKGIEAGSPSHERLASWLELHPTDDFYLESLERISDGWRDLPEEEKNLRRLDLLSDCVNVAEASGGTTRYQAGGRRICDEEFAAVKRIARKLNAPTPKSDEALLSLAA